MKQETNMNLKNETYNKNKNNIKKKKEEKKYSEQYLNTIMYHAYNVDIYSIQHVP